MAHIDWITVVGRRAVDQVDWTVNAAYLTAADWLEESCPTFKEAFGRPADWEIVKPRAPYKFARRSHDCTRTLYVHPLSAHFTFEASGQACAAAGRHMVPILAAWAPYLSRLDIAVDIETNVMPLDFDKACRPGRIQTRSKMESSTGQTVYIGSRTSERFVRIYRYYAPHPRAHLLRVEFQLKGEYARQAAQHIGAGAPIASIAAAQGVHFGLAHPVWKPDAQPLPLKVASHAQSGNTVAWMTNTIAPLMRRLQREGRLDLEAWLNEYVRIEAE